VILYVTEADEDTGILAAITDEPCESCGWPETILHVWPDERPIMRGCASCEVERVDSVYQPTDPSSTPAGVRVVGPATTTTAPAGHKPTEQRPET
jgi:hypothetical protein